MDTRKIILYAVLMVIIYSMTVAWQRDYPPARSSSVEQSYAEGSEKSVLPTIDARGAETTSLPKENPKTSDFIQVKTDVLNVHIDLAQGAMIGAKLIDYPVSIEDPNIPITLFTDESTNRYVANSSLFTAQNQEAENIRFDFKSEKKSYELSADQNTLTVVLEGKSKEGLSVKKEFVFKRGSYLIEVRYAIENLGNAPWQGFMNTQLYRSSPKEDASSLFHVGSYTGASYSNPEKFEYKKVSFKDMRKENLQQEIKSGWIAMQQHYFLSAWIPPQGETNTFYSRVFNNDYTIGIVSPLITIPKEGNKTLRTQLYVGPEDTSVLQKIAKGLDKTVDYGFLWFISAPLFSLMKMIDSWVGNWGWTIVLVTLLIKLAFYRLSAKSYQSMASMRKLQPKLLALRERFGDDKAKLSQATMELYRQEKVNPLGGCLPILIQIPVFIALYWVLLESVELRQAPFIFWIKDLAAPDPYHFLPIIMGTTMLIQQRLNPAPPDPVQAKMMMFLPILFTALFWNFPSGLVLYWIVNNTLSIVQQWYITRKHEEKASNGLIVGK